MVLGDHRCRVAQLGQHREAAAGDLQPAFAGLVAVGDTGEHEQLRLPLRRHELATQQLGRRLLDQDLGLEIKARGEAEVLVEGSRIAVDAAMLAAAVRIHRCLEPDVGAVVARDDRAAGVGEKLGRDPLRAGLLGDDAQGLEAILRVGPGTASTRPMHRDAFRGLWVDEVEKIARHRIS